MEQVYLVDVGSELGDLTIAESILLDVFRGSFAAKQVCNTSLELVNNVCAATRVLVVRHKIAHAHITELPVLY